MHPSLSTDRPATTFALFVWAAALPACSGDETAAASLAPVFDADWATTYHEVASCERSPDHDLNYVRILADDAALGPYTDRDRPFPDMSVVIKPEYADPACQSLVAVTAMRREAGFDAEGGDWHWQTVGADNAVSEDGIIASCRTCHASCGVPPTGFDWMCGTL